jgi:hypothetical protein
MSFYCATPSQFMIPPMHLNPYTHSYKPHPLCAGCPANAIIAARLDILMQKNNLQTWRYILEAKNGTTMGTPPEANYAKLYHGTWEIVFTEYFLENPVALYCQYINNGIGLWVHHPHHNIDWFCDTCSPSFASPRSKTAQTLTTPNTLRKSDKLYQGVSNLNNQFSKRGNRISIAITIITIHFCLHITSKSIEPNQFESSQKHPVK